MADSSERGEIFLVPYSHLDTQWRWEYSTTIDKYLKKTLEESIYMFEKYPGHRFNFTGAIRYSMMKEYFPELFDDVKKLVDQGRWSLAGTCLDETDALVPSSESMVRNILYGDLWQKREFGRSSRDYMIPDCFGFPGNMPTILAHCGIHGFSSQKLTWGSAVGIPFELGMWKGPDGSEIVSALNPHRYDSPLGIPVHLNPGRLARLKRLGKKNDVWKSFQYYGVGDIGGAPFEFSVKQALRSIRRSERRQGAVRIRQGGADEFFNEITDDERTRMDRYEGDFLLTNHSAGTLTSATIMKRWNRKNEQMAFAAEAAATAARYVTGARYPREKIESAWQRVIGNQMHDILPGTSTPTAYQYSQNDEVVALNTWSGILDDAAEAMVTRVPGNGDILLFNPLAEPREDSITFDVSHREDLDEGAARLVAADGGSHEVQLFRSHQGKLNAVTRMSMQPMSWARFSLEAEGGSRNIPKGESSEKPRIRREGDDWILENNHLHLKVDNHGALTSIYDIVLDKEMLNRPMAYELQREKPKMFPAWNMDWKDRRKSAAFRLEGGDVSVLVEGHQRCGLRISRKFGMSHFVKDIFLDADSAMAEFVEHIDWHESGYSLKLALNTTMAESRVTYNWESSRMVRPVNHKKQFEVPSRYWVDMKAADRGFTLVEDSKYGYDHPSEDTLRMTLVYTPATRFFNGFRDQKTHDWGHHTIRYGIRPHGGAWEGSDALARAFNQPVRAFSVDLLPGAGEGTGPVDSGIDTAASSFLSLSNPDVGVMALKLTEDSRDSDNILIRLYNRRDIDVNTDIVFSRNVSEVVEVSGLEEDMGKVEIAAVNGGFTASLKANGVAAYRVTLEGIDRPEVVASGKSGGSDSRSIGLNTDTRAFSSNRERRDGFYPAELVPESVNSGPVTYELNTEGPAHALACAGQTLELPDGGSRISLLLAADAACSAEFKWINGDGEALGSVVRKIAPRGGFIGQWDTRTWKRRPRHFEEKKRDYAWLNKCTGVEPGAVDRSRLEWYSTHIHHEGKDQAYKYGYMYTLRLDIPEGASSLQLPDESSVKVFAAAASSPNCRVRSIQALTDTFDY